MGREKKSKVPKQKKKSKQRKRSLSPFPLANSNKKQRFIECSGIIDETKLKSGMYIDESSPEPKTNLQLTDIFSPKKSKKKKKNLANVQKLPEFNHNSRRIQPRRSTNKKINYNDDENFFMTPSRTPIITKKIISINKTISPSTPKQIFVEKKEKY